MKKAKVSANHRTLCYKIKDINIIRSTEDIKERCALFFEELLQGNKDASLKRQYLTEQHEEHGADAPKLEEILKVTKTVAK